MKLNRRSFLSKLFFGIVGIVLFDAFWFEHNFIEWNTFDVSKGNKNKIKAIQLSDLHLKKIKSAHRSIAERINKELPDVLLLTGDSITRNSLIPVLKEFLSLLDPNIRKVAILGNKEYSGRIDLNVLRETYEAYNGMLLINESFVMETKFRKINILGIDDLVWGQPDFMMACENIDRTLTSLVLNHCPAYRSSIDELSSEMNIKPIILSGHTHGGQVTFFGIPLTTPNGSGKYVKGWYSNIISQMYVSKGIGTTLLPIRFCARAEVAIFYV
ncbi:MAG: metallophosphoesterase [Maribacter sp.]|uniref:metallophosphoesterase n=1 Tax=Maribacter sp. TaxID=1897614 RepID=UPI003C78532E